MSHKDTRGRRWRGFIIIAAHAAGGSASGCICGAIALCQRWITWENTEIFFTLFVKIIMAEAVLTGIVTGSR